MERTRLAARAALCAALAGALACAAGLPGPTARPGPRGPPRRLEEVGDDQLEGFRCQHGHHAAGGPAVVVGSCECDAGWGRAGLTDPLNFLTGACTQYHCVDDRTCQEVLEPLGIRGSTCPVRSWNCYCGWERAFYNWGQGWDTPNHAKPGAKCMGIMYTFSVWLSVWLLFVGERAWGYVLILAAVLLPVGRHKARCDCNDPSIWNVFRRMFRCQRGSNAQARACAGQCLGREGWQDILKDDVAWSLYVVELGVWLYALLIALWIVTVSISTMIIATIVVITFVVVAVAGILMACGEGMGECDAAVCGGCQNCGACHCDACPANCCDDCVHGGGASGEDTLFWVGGSYPYDPLWGYGGYGHRVRPGEGQVGCCASLCYPIAWLLYVFPVMPENAHGGIVGRLCGTHQHYPWFGRNVGGNSFIEFLSLRWRRRRDLHGDGAWRRRVQELIAPRPGAPLDRGAQQHGPAPHQEQMQDQRARIPEQRQPLLQQQPRIGMTNVERRQDPFDQRRDRCPESSFRSYLDGECWICTAAGEASQWDMWVSCRHMFCSGCSSEMMQRRMPCPLCRQWSSTVVRGPRCLPAAAGHAAPVAQAAEAPASGSRALRTAETFTMGE